jgi:hypothetical protein
MHGLILLLAVLVTVPPSAALQREPGTDTERTALFVYNFIRFIDWPADAFQNSTEAFRVQILGLDPFSGALDRLLTGKSINKRPIVVAHGAVQSSALLPHLVFVSAATESQLAGVLAKYCRRPVLTVSSIDRFANRGGVIGLVEQDHALRFAINQTAAEEARLQLSSQLFHLAVPLYSAISPCVHNTETSSQAR